MTAPRAEILAAAPGVQVTRFVCGAGPRDRPYPEEHVRPCMSVVLAGSFCYRCRDRMHALVPGSVMLGEPGEGFVCSHEHGVGDVCLSVSLSDALLDAVASECAAPGRLFAAPSLPPRPRIVGLARALAGAAGGGGAIDELALRLAGEVLRELAAHAGRPPRATVSTASDRGRAIAAARFLAEHAAEPLTLEATAQAVGLSTFHFLRVFRRVFGVTPHQYLVQRRVERAAARLLESDVPVTELAFEVGFGDLSNFVRTFHRLLGAPPGKFRRAYGRGKIRQVEARGRD